MTRRFQVRFKERAQADLLGGRSSSASIELRHSFSSIIAGIWPSVNLVMCFVSKFRKQDGSEANIARIKARKPGEPNPWVLGKDGYGRYLQAVE